MFGFLKNIGARTPEVSVEGYRDGEVTFRCERELKLESQKVVARLGPDEVVEATLAVETYDSASQVYSGRVEQPPELESRLLELYPPPPPEPEEEKEEEPFVERREHERLPKRLGIMSPHLKGFKGLTYDVTSVGARLIADGPVDEGKEITLRMELDDARLPPLEFKARVIWCQPSDPSEKQYFLGVRFGELGEEQQDMLDKFLDEVRNTDQGVFSREYIQD